MARLHFCLLAETGASEEKRSEEPLKSRRDSGINEPELRASLQLTPPYHAAIDVGIKKNDSGDAPSFFNEVWPGAISQNHPYRANILFSTILIATLNEVVSKVLSSPVKDQSSEREMMRISLFRVIIGYPLITVASPARS